MNVADLLRIKTSEKFKINVLMMGGKRAGKTSVLAAVEKNFSDVLGMSKLTLRPSNRDTTEVLRNKRIEIAGWYTHKDAVDGGGFTPDANPSLDIEQYPFTVELESTGHSFETVFVDVPGEFFSPGKDMPPSKKQEMTDIISDFLKVSNVLMIVIDTPYMMEDDDGAGWNEKRNVCQSMSRMIMKNFISSEGGSSVKMALFVPLKCERHRTEGRMNEVAAKVKECYGELIEFLKQNGCESVVTPIFTMKTAVFDHFKRDEDTLDVIIDEIYDCPKFPIYHITPEGLRDKKPRPECCEQPLVCTIAYALSLAVKESEKRKAVKDNASPLVSTAAYFAQYFSDKLSNWLYYGVFADLASSEEFMAQLVPMLRSFREKLDDGELGYEIFSDPIGLGR